MRGGKSLANQSMLGGGVVVLILLLPPAIAILNEDDTAQASVNMALKIITSLYHLEQTLQKKIKIVIGGI